jgi:uncharacterized protein (DUF983 family)
MPDTNPYQPSSIPQPKASDAPLTPDGKHCPVCGEDIGLWPVMSAMYPTRIWCPHCRSRLGYQGPKRLVAAMIVLTIAIVTPTAFGLLWMKVEPVWRAVAYYLAIVLPLCVVMMMLTAMRVRATNTLRKMG